MSISGGEVELVYELLLGVLGLLDPEESLLVCYSL